MKQAGSRDTARHMPQGIDGVVMIDPNSIDQLRNGIRDQIAEDHELLNTLRAEVRPLAAKVHRIQPRSTTSFALVGTDGGNNRVQFDPFLIQLIRVVDSSNNEYCLDVVSPTMDMDQLSARQFDKKGAPVSALGHLMSYLRTNDLTQISHMIRRPSPGRPVSPAWVQVYRELVEWATLFHILRSKDFATDTIFVCDGLLRSKIFANELFPSLLKGIGDSLVGHWRRSRRRIYLTGVCKSSKVLDRYRLAMVLEGILQTEYAAFVEVDRSLERNAYVWDEYARGSDVDVGAGEVNKFVGGKMFYVKFGRRPNDPIWPIDIFIPQAQDASTIMGYMLADAVDGGHGRSSVSALCLPTSQKAADSRQAEARQSCHSRHLTPYIKKTSRNPAGWFFYLAYQQIDNHAGTENKAVVSKNIQ